MLKSKSETPALIQQFSIMVETQFNVKIKCIRSENGTEFIMKDFFKSKGILYQLSCVDTPQQNAIVERKYQHILNVARALRFHSSLPLKMWGDCIFTAVYLINRLPSKHLNNKTPYEMLFKQPPSYCHIRIFGCLYFISTLSHNRHKFVPRARKCVFLGNPHGIKGYKVLDLESNSIHVSRDVVFYETIFPFASTSSSSHFSSNSSIDAFHDSFVFPYVDSTDTVSANHIPTSSL